MTLFTDLQKLYEDHCTKVVCVNGSMLAKDLLAVIEAHRPKEEEKTTISLSHFNPVIVRQP